MILQKIPTVTRECPLKIMLVDDQLILLDVLSSQLSADGNFKVVGVAQSVQDALSLAEKMRPDAVMLDIDLGGGQSGLDAVPRLRLMLPDVHLVMASVFDHPMYRDRAFEMGANVYVTKGVRFESLRAVLLNNAKGLVSGDVNRCWWRRGDVYRSACLTLSGRELTVVRALASGKRESDVAQELSISVSSVGTYLRRAMIKMGCGTRAELFRDAVALGGLPSESLNKSVTD